jgi:hypothetical protein
VAPRELRAIKRTAISRIHYEWALAYLAQGKRHASKAFLQLLKSIRQYPFFALKRPMGTAFILKEAALGTIAAARMRFNAQPGERQVLRGSSHDER